MKVKPDSFIILTPGFPEDENDTSCLPLQQSFVRELKVQHPQLDIIILSLQYPYKQEIYKWHEVTVLSFGGRNKRGIPKLFLRQKLFSELSKLHRETSIRGLLSFWLGEGALVGSRFAERNKLIHRCWVLGQDAKKENKYAGLIRPKNDELLALSDFISMELWKNHQLHSSKAYPGIKVDGTKIGRAHV